MTVRCILILLVVSLVGCGSGDDGPVVGNNGTATNNGMSNNGVIDADVGISDSDTGTVGEDDAGPATNNGTATAPLIREVFDCGKKGVSGGVQSGTDLVKVPLDTETYPNAVCNDGTGAVLFVRRAADPQFENSWLVRLQGGGSCGSPQACAERWCSAGTNFGMDKMTTAMTPDGIAAPGLSALTPENPLRDWNHAFLYYCSSDGWSGQAHDVQATADVEGTEEAYTIHFHGADILDAAFASLRRESGATLSYSTPQGDVTLPDLDDAERIVLAGASAGSSGVMRNIDRLAATFPGIPFVGIHDSGFAPSFDTYDFSNSTHCTENGLCDWETFLQARHQNSSESFWKQRTDASCLEMNAGEEWRCDDGSFVIKNHITTPLFVRLDQRDPSQSEKIIEARLEYAGEPVDLRLFSQLVAEQVGALATLTDTSAEGAAIAKAPGWFSPSCAKHETLANNGAMFNTSIPAANGTQQRMLDVFTAWMGADMPMGLIAQPGDGSICP